MVTRLHPMMTTSRVTDRPLFDVGILAAGGHGVVIQPRYPVYGALFVSCKKEDNNTLIVHFKNNDEFDYHWQNNFL